MLSITNETYRYYVVYEVYGNYNAIGTTIEMDAPIDSEDAIATACDLIRAQYQYPKEGIVITNWKRL